MTSLHITVGIPASGKSTWAKANECNFDIILSSDAIRQELTGDATNQDVNDKVFRTLHERVRAGLQNGFRVLVDATNLKQSSRNKLLAIALECEVPAYAHLFQASKNFTVCQARNQGRDRVVPDHVMSRFFQGFQRDCTFPQLVLEGWVTDEVFS